MNHGHIIAVLATGWIAGLSACSSPPGEVSADDSSDLSTVEHGTNISCFGGTDGSFLGQASDPKKGAARRAARDAAVARCSAACPSGGTCTVPDPSDAICVKQSGQTSCEVCSQCIVPVVEVVACHDVDVAKVAANIVFAVHADGTFRGDVGAFTSLETIHGPGTVADDGAHRTFTFAQSAGARFVLGVSNGGATGGPFDASVDGVLPQHGAFSNSTLRCTLQ